MDNEGEKTAIVLMLIAMLVVGIAVSAMPKKSNSSTTSSHQEVIKNEEVISQPTVLESPYSEIISLKKKELLKYKDLSSIDKFAELEGEIDCFSLYDSYSANLRGVLIARNPNPRAIGQAHSDEFIRNYARASWKDNGARGGISDYCDRYYEGFHSTLRMLSNSKR